MRWGVGAGGSRLISGTMTVHRRLEERLADFAGRQSCLLFGSGYLANLGVIGALAGRGDTVFSDELNHASIVDGCRLSRAEVVVYRHRDTEHLLWSMRRHGGRRRAGRDGALIVDRLDLLDGRRRGAAGRSSSSWRRPQARASWSTRRTRSARTDRTVAARSRRAGPGGRGRRDRRHAGQVARLLRRVRVRRRGDDPLPAEHVRARSSSRRPRRRRRSLARWRRWSCCSSARTASSAWRPTRARCAARSRREGFQVRRRRHAHRSADRGRGARHDAPVPGGDRAGRLRAGDPSADGAGGHLAPAPGGDGLAHGERHAPGGGGARRVRRASSA